MDASAVPLVDETNDSCITHQSLDRDADTYSAPDTTGHVSEVKQECLPYVKTEDAHESDMEYGNISMNVRVYGLLILMLLMHAAYLLGYVKVKNYLAKDIFDR